MREVGVHEAKTHLSRLLRYVAAGEEVVICRDGTPVARLVPFEPERQPVLGRDAGTVEITKDFDAPLPEDLLETFET